MTTLTGASMIRSLFVSIAFLGFLAVLPSANAAVSVFGSTKAQECFEGAEVGRKDAGLRECDEALGEPQLLASDRAATYVNRGIIYNRIRKLDLALDDFNEAIEIDAELGEAYLNRGNTYFFQRAFEEALSDYSKAVEFGTTEPQVAYFNRALVYEVMKRYAEAKVDLLASLEVDPEFGPARERLAVIEEELRRTGG